MFNGFPSQSQWPPFASICAWVCVYVCMRVFVNALGPIVNDKNDFIICVRSGPSDYVMSWLLWWKRQIRKFPIVSCLFRRWRILRDICFSLGFFHYGFAMSRWKIASINRSCEWGRRHSWGFFKCEFRVKAIAVINMSVTWWQWVQWNPIEMGRVKLVSLLQHVAQFDFQLEWILSFCASIHLRTHNELTHSI